MGNDITWMFSIVGLLAMMGIFIPVLEETLAYHPIKMNASAFIPGGVASMNKSVGTGDNIFSALHLSIGPLFKGLFNAFLYTWSWMWTTGILGSIFGTFHIIMRLVLIALIYRQVRSGGG